MGEKVDLHVGEYHLTERIGSGGMGTVYLGTHAFMGRTHAVKVLSRELAGSQGFVDRFRAEARLMATLNYPGIVKLHYAGEWQGEYFLAMEYVAGPSGQPESLRDRLRSVPEGRVDEDQVCAWVLKIAEALAYAHDRGVVHRDIKPGNILIDAAGDVKLADFGLAKAVGNEVIQSRIQESLGDTLSGRDTVYAPDREPTEDSLEPPATPRSGPSGLRGAFAEASGILGTYDYMAPEQRGDFRGVIDERTDIYAFGVLLYRMLTGRLPMAMGGAPSDVIPGLCKTWDTMASRCLAYAPSDRYPSAGSLLKQLREVAAEISSRAEAETTKRAEEEQRQQAEGEQETKQQQDGGMPCRLVVDLDEISATHRIEEGEALAIIDKWSTSNRRYLWPLSRHVEVVVFANFRAIIGDFVAFVEERSLRQCVRPATRPLELRTFDTDIWEVPIELPAGFAGEKLSWEAPRPHELTACTVCRGVGTCVCESCNGTGGGNCWRCGGMGIVSAQLLRCPNCGGTGRSTCPGCDGQGRYPCETCEAVGRVHVFPVVEAIFSEEHACGFFSESDIHPTLNACEPAFIGATTQAGHKMPPVPVGSPNWLAKKLEASFETFLRQISTRGVVRSTGLTLSYVAAAECRMRHRGRPFTMAVDTVARKLIRGQWVPRNWRRLAGKILIWVGSVVGVLSLVQSTVIPQRISFGIMLSGLPVCAGALTVGLLLVCMRPSVSRRKGGSGPSPVQGSS